MKNGVMVVQDDPTQTADFYLGPLANLAVVTPTTLTLLNNGMLIHNKGSMAAASTRAITLPATSVATINGTFYSLFYEFCDYSGYGLQINANTGQQIAIGDLINITISGGYIVNRLQYNRIKLMLLDTGIWVSDPNPNWEVQTS
jgi:hypothetical protein